MRIAIISDIHGNQVALEAVLQDLERQPAIDQLVIAGDLCLNGPCPRQVLENELVALFMHHGFEHVAHGALGERKQVLMEDLLVWEYGGRWC